MPPGHIQHYLERDVALAQNSETQRFVSDFGKSYVGRKKPRSLRFGAPKSCFENASEAVCNGPEELFGRIGYVEGYAALPDQPPFHHAWITIEEQAVELTIKHNPLEIDFFGVSFSRSEVMKLLRKSGTFGLLSPPIAPDLFELVGRRVLVSRPLRNDLPLPKQTKNLQQSRSTFR